MRGKTFRNSLMLLVFALSIFAWRIGEATLWFLSPPFPNESGKAFSQDLLTELGGESNVTVSKIAHRWKPALPDEKGYMNLLHHYLTTDNKVVYALGTFDAKKRGIGVWRFGSNDGIKVWVNGKLAHSLLARRRAQKDGDECLSALAAGENTVLLKIDNDTGDWGFHFRLAEVFPREKGRHALVFSLRLPPYLLYGSQYPIEQWAFARVLNNGSEPLEGAIVQLELDGTDIGKTPLGRGKLAPVASLECRVRLKVPFSQAVESASGKARVLFGEKEVGTAKSFSVRVREVHPLLTGRVRDEDGILRFVHATDTHVIAAESVLNGLRTADNMKGAVRAINKIAPPPDFLMVTGDLTTDSVPGLDYFAELMKPVRVRWLMIPGNHDKPGGEAAVLRLFGRHGLPLYYSFDYAGYHMVCLDGEPPSGSPVDGGFIPEEIEWLNGDLKLAKGKETLVFVHQHPLLTRIGERERLDGMVDWPELVATLESFPQVKWVFCGHAHVDYFAQRHGIRYVLTTATAYQFSPSDFPYFAHEPGVRLMQYKEGKVASRFLRIDGTWRDDPPVEDCPEFSLNPKK